MKAVTWRGYLWLFMLAIIWGSSFILIKRALVVYTAWELGALRTFIGGFVLLPFAWQAWRRLSFRVRRISILIGLFGSLLPALLFAIAQQRIDSATSGVLNALTPLFVLLLGRLFFGHGLRLIEIIGVGMGLGGSLGLLMQEGFRIEGYAFFAIIATVCYGVNINLIHRYARDVPAWALASLSLVFMLPPAAGILLTSNFLAHFTTHPAAAWQALGYVSFLGVMGTAVAFFIFNQTIRVFGGLFASLVTYLIPIVAVGWGLWDGEILSVVQGLGIVLILLGVYLTKPKNTATTSAPPPAQSNTSAID